MRASDIIVYELLKEIFPRPLPTRSIVRHTDLSFSAVRESLNHLYGDEFVRRELSIGLNGHTIYEWSWSGKERV